MSEQTSLSFLDSHRPVLSAGDYVLTATQTITFNEVEEEGKEEPTYELSIDKQFTVDGPKYRLLPDDVGSVFPPSDSVGGYATVLPHVTLTRSMLPWERTAGSDATVDGPPWLAILLIYESESGSITPGVVKQSDLDKSNRDETVKVIDADSSFLKACLPSKADLSALCHVRIGTPEVAVVLCGRVPHATEMNTAYLVSVERCYAGTDFAASFTSPSSKARLVVLKSWRFTPGDPAQSLQNKLSKLHAAPFTAGRQSAIESPPGAALFSYRMRGGGSAAAFYRGPFAPCKVDTPVDNGFSELRSGDSLIRYKEGVGVFDVSYAAAWQLGRLLALASSTFSQTLIRWKHDAKATVLARVAQANVPHLDFGKSVTPDAESVPVPLEVSSFIVKLKSLELVPVNYLLPDADALPPESLRYFQVDEYWMRSLLEGAVSIGRNLASDAQHEIEVRTAIESNPATSFSKLLRSGFLVRSEVVAGYPNLIVEATDNGAVTTLRPSVTRLIAPGLKLYLFDSVPKSFTLHPAPVEVHCEKGSLAEAGNKLILNQTSSAQLAKELTAQVTGVEVIPTGTLQLFYRSAGKGLSSRWRNPDGGWSNEQSFGGQLLFDPVAAVIPGTGILQLFYAGLDHAVWSRWRNPDRTWSNEHRIGGDIAGDSLGAAVIPGTNVLQLFYVGTDHAIWSRWRNPDGTWSSEQRIGGRIAGNSLVAAVIPGANVLQLFYVGTDDAIWSLWRNPNGTWSDEHRIGGALRATARLSAATIPGANILQLFYLGTDSTIWSLWRDSDGNWSAEQHIGGNPVGDPVPAIVPDTDILELLYVGKGNAIWSLSRNPDGTWSSPEQRIGGNVASANSLSQGGVAVIPGTDILQLFYVGTDLAIWSLGRNPDGSWSSPEQRIGGKLDGNVIAVALPD